MLNCFRGYGQVNDHLRNDFVCFDCQNSGIEVIISSKVQRYDGDLTLCVSRFFKLLLKCLRLQYGVKNTLSQLFRLIMEIALSGVQFSLKSNV